MTPDHLLDQLTCGAALVSSDGRILRANASLEALLGLDAASLDGRLLVDIADEPARPQLAALIAAGEPGRLELNLRSSAQEPIAIAASTSSAPPDGAPRLLTIIDMRPQKRMEATLRESYADITQLSDTILEQALALRDYSKTLEQRVRERTAELHEVNIESICMLAVAAEEKDFDTGMHVRRIQSLVQELALAGGVSPREAEHIGWPSILHDVGKIHVPDVILRKPGPLDETEWEAMRAHTIIGERILSKRPFFDVARAIARHHHENWDGSGYPDGLSQEQIPLAARLTRIADVYDALSSGRPYKEAWQREAVIDEIRGGAGRLFDPTLVEPFLALKAVRDPAVAAEPH